MSSDLRDKDSAESPIASMADVDSYHERPETHTPGPWRERQATGTLARLIRGTHSSVCEIPLRFGDVATRNANARLIAAAPDLLAALEAIAEGMGRYSRDPLTHCENTVEDMKRLAIDAIAHAKGEAQ